MLELVKKHPRYAFGALLVHIFFLVLFGVGIHFKSQERAATTQQMQTVKVTTVDQKLVQKELRSFKAQDEQARRQREELVQKRKAEEKRLAQLQAQRLAEQKQQQQQLALAKQREEQLKKKQAEQQKKLAAEKKRLKELARKRREQEKRQLQAQNEQTFKQQLAAEAKQLQQQQQIAAQRQAARKAKQTEIGKYMDLIENKIYQHWVMPPSTNKGLVCIYEVTLIPTGDVVSIELSKSSGDSVYDQSVKAAIQAASPLPVPPAKDGLFDEFRNLTLPVRADKKI